MRKITLLLAAVFGLSCASNAQTTKEPELREKIGQMIVSGFRGFEAGSESEIAHYVRDLGIGGVIYFDRDVPTATNKRNVRSPEQLQKLSADLQALAKTPLLIAIDQEGGRVSRLKEQYGFPKTVSAQYLGTKNDPELTRKWAAATAKELKKAGINLDFAPNTDVNVNPKCPVIGAVERSFSADPAVVTRHAGIWIDELHREDVLTSLKHFPGHGSSTVDSHLGLTDITTTWKKDIELQPYKTLIDQGYNDIVMIGHLLHREVDPDYPASLSRKWIEGVLRNELGFLGVVITDDMNMGAIVDHYSLKRALELSINAGVDMIILGNNGKVFEDDLTPRAIDLIETLVSEGKISKERIDEAYNRILELKNR